MPDAASPEHLPRDLHYVDDSRPGISRKKRGKAFQY
jgi:DNA topoisomerase-1